MLLRNCVRPLLGVSIVALLGACSSLPSSGPADRAIASEAAVHLKARSSQIDYALIDISKATMPYFTASASGSLRDGFGTGGGKGVPKAVLGIGDVVEVSIFEAQAGGLFTPLEGARPGNYVTLPAQTVDQAGMISVPYAGDIKVSGRPVADVQDEIRQKLANRAIEPQVLISTTLSRSSRLSILGDVNAPAEMDVSPGGERVLDIVSRAGGLTAPGVETYVTVERNGRTLKALFDTIVTDPRENIYVLPGDTIYVSRERRTFLAFGAAGLNGRFDFNESNLTLGEALAKAGGLLDSRANPSEVFLYRLVERKTVEKTGADLTNIDGKVVPVIFRANLRDPAMFFAVQGFAMKDKDIVYISNSGATELSKFLEVINGVSNTAANIPVNLASTKNAVEELAN